jgi:hypothetical protein
VYIVSSACLLVLNALLFFAFEDGIECSKALFPPLPRVLNPGLKLSQGLVIEAVEVLLRAFVHHHQVCLTQGLEVL